MLHPRRGRADQPLALPETFRKSGGGLAFKQPFFLWRTLPDPAPWSWNVFREGGAVPLVADASGLSAVFEDGLHAPIGEAIDAALADEIRDPGLVWLTAVEASPFAGNAQLPMALALSADGTAIAAIAVERAGRLSGDVAVPGDTFGAAPGSSRSSAASSVPPPRSAFAGVSSRARKTVFVVGGTSADGRALDDLWIFDFADARWRKVDLPSGVLGRVESAVYTYRDRRLWVMDTDPANRDRTRIVRIEVETGANEVVLDALGKRPPKYDLRGLTLDMDGKVVLYAASTAAENHRLATLSMERDGLALGRTALRHRALAAPPCSICAGSSSSTRRAREAAAGDPTPTRSRRAIPTASAAPRNGCTP